MFNDGEVTEGLVAGPRFKLKSVTDDVFGREVLGDSIARATG